MRLTRSLRLALGAALCVMPVFAFAHPGHDESGVMAGVAHPLTGLDHLLAMFAVGLWAAQQTGSTRWILPTTFVGCMLMGGLLGFGGMVVPWLETGIAASVLALGLLVAVAARLPRVISLLITGLFGLAHGIAHGLELPQMSSPMGYAIGFVLATSALHAAGYGLARWMSVGSASLIKSIGLALAGSGVGLLVV